LDVTRNKFFFLVFSHNQYNISIDNAKKGCRILARRIKKLGYDAKFENFQIVNILTKLQLPFRIRIHEMVNCDPLKFMFHYLFFKSTLLL